MSRIQTPAVVALAATLAVPAFADADMHTVKENLYDADYEAVLADHGYLVGAAVYGKYDADYEAYLTTPNTFATASVDAPYVATLKEQQVAGLTFPVPYGTDKDAPIFLGSYDADYEPYVSTAATFAYVAEADTHYVATLKEQQVAGLTFPVPYGPNGDAQVFLGSYDADYEPYVSTAATFAYVDEADTHYVAQLKAQQIAGLTFPTPYGPDKDQLIFLGNYDADYEPYVTSPETFMTASFEYPAPTLPDTIELGHYDADYEVVLAEHNIPVGVALYGKYDADYEAYLTQQQTIRAAEVAFPKTTLLASR